MKALKRKYRKKIQRFSYLYRRITSPLRVFPSFIIIGCAKSGTTSLYNYLIQHPAVFPAYKKEIHYFSKYYERGDNWYRTYFCTNIYKKIKYPRGNTVTGEATPYYIFHPLAALRVKKVLPDAKIICILRNPVDRAYSHYSMMVRLGYEHQSFKEAINEEYKRLKDEEKKLINDPTYYSFKYQNFSYLSRGHYEKQLRTWFKIFDKSQFLIIKSENLYRNPQIEINKIFKFLNVPEYNLKETKVFGETNKLKKIDKELRKKIAQYYKPYNEKLYSLLDQNFYWEDEAKINY